ncbi:TetR/AcrR family transcriptional regulator [Actinomadura physcomitrii]|uniref:TetR/AcrR family transcriptional regulator n=1 Tax=Actinomadura physcomitrii TaxID=2650748 RepID=UPI00136B2D1F|nr:TetR/AcrR family transcriptional regulator [Actinomadura physcomitrii]
MDLGVGSNRDQVVAVAKRLFADLGYDQTTSEMIARSAGVPMSFVTDECGGRQQIYRRIVQEIRDRAQEVLASLLAEEGLSARGRFRRLLDELLEYFSRDREGAAIWRQRSIGDASDIQGVEDSYAKPAFDAFARLVGDALRPEVDVELMTWTLMSAIDNFFNGIPYGVGQESPDPVMVERFHRHIHALVEPFFR